MKNAKPFLFFLLFSTFFFNLSAQNLLLSYTNCDELFVCHSDTFTVKIVNNNPGPVTNATLNVGLPSGLYYELGSVTGATEQNVSNTAMPVFSIAQIPAGQSVTIKWLLRAACEAADVLDAGQLFVAQLSLSSAQGNVSLSTSSIPVETGAVVIQSITGQLLSGEKDDTLLRTICVKNTRLGKIGNLHLEDTHAAGFSISVSGASGPVETPVSYNADFAAGAFANVGNHDSWLDLNETICLTEKIVITSCGTPPFVDNSLIRVGWGCGGTVCRYDSVSAIIEIKASTKIPDLKFEKVWAPPVDYCGNIPVVMGYKIKNQGKAAAKNIIFNLVLTEGIAQAAVRSGTYRIVSNAGTTSITPNLVTPNILNACGLPGDREANFVIPVIPALDSIEFLFDVFTCAEPCDQVQPAFRVDYFFQKDCPVNGFVSGNALIIPEDGYTVKGNLKANIGSCLEPGNSYPIDYEAVSRYLTEDGFWHLLLDLPLGITLDTSCGTLLGSHAPVLFDVQNLPDGSSKIHLAWATPVEADSLLAHLCIHYECDTNIVCIDPDVVAGPGVTLLYTQTCCFTKFKDRSYWSPALNTDPDCGINDCHEKYLALHVSCRPDTISPPDTSVFLPIIPAPGMRTRWDVYRLNLGFRDNDDDRHADLPLGTAPPTVRRDRFLAGDTLRVEFVGRMDTTGFVVDTIYRSIWQEVVGSDMALNGNDQFMTQSAQTGFVDSTKFRFLQNIIKVKYADGTEYTCPYKTQVFKTHKNYFQVVDPNSYPVTPLDDIATENFSFLVSMPAMVSQGCLPKPLLEYGDSIFIYTDFKIDTNFKPSSNNTPDPPLVGFRTATSYGGLVYAWNTQPFKRLQYSGWRKSYSPNTHSIKPCSNSTEVKQFRYSFRIARENMFPFEVRPLARISDYWQTLSGNVEPLSSTLEYLVLQDSVPYLKNIGLPFDFTSTALHIHFDTAFQMPVDEGFTLRNKLIFKPDCQFLLPDTSKQFIRTNYYNCLNGMIISTLDSLKNSIGFYANAPKLVLLSSDSIVYSPTNTFGLDFSIKNVLPNQAQAAWLAVVSPSGQASDFNLFKLPQNQAVQGLNGFFNLGNNYSQGDYHLEGRNISCETDSLLVIYGWDCAPPSGLSESSCGRDSFWVTLHLEKPELELDVLQEQNPLTLCDTSDWFEFEIYNAKIGYAYNLDALVKLPAGLHIVSGTCQASYPEGALWTNVSDPQALGASSYRWKVNDILPTIAANGLAGVNLQPQNSFHIRFKVLAECGFVANTPIIYGADGYDPCGRQSNVLNKPGEPLIIEGLSPAYGVQISTQILGSPNQTCGSEQELSATLSILGSPSANDSIYVILPQGVSYVSGSYQPGTGAPAGPPQVNAQGFQLAMPAVSGGSLFSFTYKVHYGASAGCSDQLILIQSRQKSEAFCQSSGIFCEVYLATGEGSWKINVDHVQWQINPNSLEISLDPPSAKLNVSNIGTTNANEGVLVQVWRDVDGDGQLSAGDQFLQNLQNTGPVAAGNSVELNGPWNPADSIDLCRLLLVLPANPNCTCDTQVVTLHQYELTHKPLLFCDLSPKTIGITGQSGYNYAWEPANLVACQSCPSTTFTPISTDPLTLTLTGSTSGCVATNVFDISFGATAAISTSNSPICEGKSAVLSVAPAGTTYSWSGPGISNPALAAQTVKPGSSANYFVTVTFSNGCNAKDSISIVVLPADTLQLADQFTCEGEAVDVLGTLTAAPGTYQLVLHKVNGCDSTLLQTLKVRPKPMTDETKVFCLGDSLQVLDTLFTGSGEICRTYTAFNGCDSTHCVTVTAVQPPKLTPQDTIQGDYGQIITLTGPNGYVTYVWEPLPTPPCTNCPTVTYPSDSSGYHEVILTVTDPNGCSGELIYSLLIFPPCSADSLDIPNAFTPNGDGANDLFRVVAHEGAEVVSGLEIYDRWGVKVYENQGNAAWDGTIDGKPAPSDVYVYVVTISCGELRQKRVGDVTLLR